MTNWELFFDQKIKEVAKGKVIWDIGGGFGFQKQLAPYKQYFSGEYKTLDINEDLRPDVVADAHNLPILDNSADGVISNSVLEHMRNPFQAVSEMYRILRPGGKVFAYVPFLHAYHGGNKKGGPDYWRMSRDGLQYLFREFSHIEICPVAGYFETMSYLLPRSHKFPFKLCIFPARLADRISCRFQSSNQVSGHHVFLIK